MENKAFREDQIYLEKVESYIERRIGILEEKKTILRHEISMGRKDMWEEGRHGVNDFDDVVDIYRRSEGIVADERKYADNLKELERLHKMKENPYFASIDVAEEGYPGEERFYIGAVGLRDDKTYDMYVCDWRAPISELFYGFDVGKAWYEADGRCIHVELTGKRQIQIAKGRLRNIYDTDSAMHDAILGNILSENTTNKLKVIVSSIQKEQNTAIRKIDKQAVLIYGPAGSGKTSVGLHRLAYILYHQRDRIHAEDIVILSNNNIYHSYVSGILPALCEDEVSHMIFHDLLRRFLPADMKAEGYYEQYNALQRMDKESQRREWIKTKYAGETLRYVEEYFTHYEFDYSNLTYCGEVIVTAEMLRDKVKRNQYQNFEGGLQGVSDTIKKLYEDYFAENKESICGALEARVKEYVSAQELEILFIKTKRRVMQDALDTFVQKNNLNAKTQVVRVLESYVNAHRKGDISAAKMCDKLKRDVENGHLWYEDALLYLLVRIYMGEVSAFDNALHVLVDEAQDYSLLQLAILKHLYPQSSFTLLADVCQAISPETTIGSNDEFGVVFGSELEKLPLLKSYRSTGAINALAFHLMEKFQKNDACHYSYFMRAGKTPHYIVSQNMRSSIWHILEGLASYNQVGILAKDEMDANRISQWLQSYDEPIQLINRPNDEMKARIVIIPLILSKGLEFDAVLVCDLLKGYQTEMNQDYSRETMRLAAKMYLSCTRALHELYFVEKFALPEDLQDCSEYLQIVEE